MPRVKRKKPVVSDGSDDAYNPVEQSGDEFKENISRRSTRIRSRSNKMPKLEVKEDSEEELPKKRITSSGRGYSSGYSKSARSVLVRGVKSCVTAEIVSLKFTGCPVDLECQLKTTHCVKSLPAGGGYYDVMLNQTNIAANNNKYYILQLLERHPGSNSGPLFAVWFRWGRVGHINGTMLKAYDHVDDLDDAIHDFSKKFFDKTKNRFDERDEFEHVPGKYDWVQRDYGPEDEIKDEPNTKADVKIEPCELDIEIQDLLNIICNVKMMEKYVKEMKFDLTKAPLGKLSHSQIKRGFAILAEIETKLKEKISKSLTSLSSQYFTHIPHDFGFRRLPIINTIEAVADEVELLRSLDEITVAVSLNHGAAQLHPLTNVYANLKCNLALASSDECDFVRRYITQSHGETHTNYSIELDTLYTVERHDKPTFKGPKSRANWHYLWHGSRLTNMAGIMSRGLRIAPADAPVTGYMFGKGIYFADCASKSANYCHATVEEPTGLLLLCRVALGKEKEVFDADERLPASLGKFDSIKAIGKNIPSNIEHFDDTLVPSGKHEKYANPEKCSLLYSEYVVYDTARVQICYAAKVKFVFDDLW